MHLPQPSTGISMVDIIAKRQSRTPLNYHFKSLPASMSKKDKSKYWWLNTAQAQVRSKCVFYQKFVKNQAICATKTADKQQIIIIGPRAVVVKTAFRVIFTACDAVGLAQTALGLGDLTIGVIRISRRHIARRWASDVDDRALAVGTRPALLGRCCVAQSGFLPLHY